jgi:transposase
MRLPTARCKWAKIDSFIKGLKADIDAVRNVIIYSWSNGFVEGSVNRLKTKKEKCMAEQVSGYLEER